MRRYRPFAVPAPALALLLALSLGACGGTSPNAIVKSAPPSTVAAAPTPTLTPGPWQPGTDSLAQTAVVAKAFLSALQTEDFSEAGLWAKDATFDMSVGDEHATGAEAVRALYEEEAPLGVWQAGNVLVGPGVVAYEGQFLQAGFSSAALDLLAVSGGKIVHEEVFLDSPSSIEAMPVTPWATPPASGDSIAQTTKTAAAFIEAVDAQDTTAIQVLLAGDVLFYDTALKHEHSGQAQVMNWWGTMNPVAFHSVQATSMIVGPGWAVARWTATGSDADTSGVIVPGATVMEIRDGKVVRLALYYDSTTLPLHD